MVLVVNVPSVRHSGAVRSLPHDAMKADAFSLKVMAAEIIPLAHELLDGVGDNLNLHGASGWIACDTEA